MTVHRFRYRTYRAIAVGLIVACASLLAITAHGVPSDAPVPMAKPKAPPIVTIKKSDGTIVHGQLVESDGVRLVVKSADGKSSADSVEVPWKDVKAVSNGVTQAKALAAWKTEHHADLCKTCWGDRVIPCSVCKGTGHDPASSKDCKTCKGEQQIKCTNPKCDHGFVPCPGKCLKLTVGNWSKPDEHGKRWVSITSGRSTFKFSDGHVGEIPKIDHDQFYGTEACPICGKTGKVVCPVCDGRSFVPCPTCKADKKAADCASCEDGTKLCPTCNGSGLKDPAPKPVRDVKPEPTPAPAAPQPVPKAKSGDGLE